MNRVSAWLSLFASTSTLLCCALPSLLVVLGMGASMAGLVSSVPQIVVLSEYKEYVFGFSGLMIGLAFFFQSKSESLSCPADPELAKSCDNTRRLSKKILIFSAVLWLVGFFFAFLAPLMF